MDVLAIGDDNHYYVKFKDGCESSRVELESQKVSETSLSHHFSTLTETGLRNVILALPRLVSETFFSFLTETRLGDLFSTLLRLVS